MHGLQACLFKYITVAAFRIYAQRGEGGAKRGGGGGLEAMHLIGMEITLLIIENHGKIMELCFPISVGTLRFKGHRKLEFPLFRVFLEILFTI